MITDAFIYILSGILGALSLALPKISIWPQSWLDGIQFLLSSLLPLNFIFPIDALFSGAYVFVNFLILYYGYKILVSIYGYFRGSSNIKT